MKDAWYDFFVRKNEWIRREYERYVIEHIEEHDKLRFLDDHWSQIRKIYKEAVLAHRQHQLFPVSLENQHQQYPVGTLCRGSDAVLCRFSGNGDII